MVIHHLKTFLRQKFDKCSNFSFVYDFQSCKMDKRAHLHHYVMTMMTIKLTRQCTN